MNFFLVRGDDGGHAAAEGDLAGFGAEVIGGDAGESAHETLFPALQIIIGVFQKGRGDEFLHEPGGGGVILQGSRENLSPFGGGEVMTYVNAAGSPGFFMKTGYFDNKAALFLAHAGDFVPIVYIQPGKGRLWGKWSGVYSPGVREELLQVMQMAFPEAFFPL